MSLWDLFTHIVQSSKTLDFELKWYVSSLLNQNNWVLRDRISQQNVWICWLPTSISVNLVQMIFFACNFECYRVTWIVSWPFSICFLKGLVFVLFRQWHFFVQWKHWSPVFTCFAELASNRFSSTITITFFPPKSLAFRIHSMLFIWIDQIQIGEMFLKSKIYFDCHIFMRHGKDSTHRTESKSVTYVAYFPLLENHFDCGYKKGCIGSLAKASVFWMECVAWKSVDITSFRLKEVQYLQE